MPHTPEQNPLCPGERRGIERLSQEGRLGVSAWLGGDGGLGEAVIGEDGVGACFVELDVGFAEGEEALEAGFVLLRAWEGEGGRAC